jgi:uncharacterized alkaline shock family protein YloU
VSNDPSATDIGAVKIHKNVIASIARLAAEEIEGVRQVGGNLTSGIIEFVGGKTSGAIKVDIDTNDEIKLQVPLVIQYDFNIPEVALRVQENIRSALEKMTSLSVREITINVQGIEKGGRV